MKIEDIIIWILFIISIGVGLWYLFGNSPTLEQALLVLILTVVFTISINLTKVSMEIKFLKKRFNKLENSFVRLINDLRSSKKIT